MPYKDQEQARLYERTRYASNARVRAYKKDHSKRNRFARRLRDYGINFATWVVLRASQDNACAICLVPFESEPSIDHNHETGRVRGLLCETCNGGLGMFFDSPKILAQAALYVEARNGK